MHSTSVSALKEEISIPVDLHSHCTRAVWLQWVIFLHARQELISLIPLFRHSPGAHHSRPRKPQWQHSAEHLWYRSDLFLLTEIKNISRILKKKYRGILRPHVREDRHECLEIPDSWRYVIYVLVSQLKSRMPWINMRQSLRDAECAKNWAIRPPCNPTSQIVGTTGST